jgi:hypothetical protein
VSSPGQSFSFYRAGGDAEWTDGNGGSFGEWPEANVLLTSRNTAVTITITDVPAFTPQTYTLNILSKTSNDIILPSDEDSDGRLRASFASGPKVNVTAEHVLPGEYIEVVVEANLGYYIDWEGSPYSVPGGIDAGVSVAASTISMGTDPFKDITLVSDPGDWKTRKYRFYMPDENVVFSVQYRETAEKLDRIAYVAPPDKARRGGGYKSGEDRQTATSWGTASHDLQAVINSFFGQKDNEDSIVAIWVLKGTYNPPNPDNYEVVTQNNADKNNNSYNCFPVTTGPAADYHVIGYDFTGITGKEDIAFVIRPEVILLGGFDETDDELSDRESRISGAIFEASVLSGENIEDGTRAHHVVIAAGSGDAELDGFIISGGIGPETPSTIQVNPPVPGSGATVSGTTYSINRQHGGGIYAVDSSLKLKNVTISNNTSTSGGGMYSISSDSGDGSTLTNVDFFNNKALESGGGMYNINCKPKIDNSRFRENSSVNQGGGLFVAGGNLQIYNSQFHSNSAKQGGGLFNSGGESLLEGVSVSGNWTSGNGSGIWNGSIARYYNLTVYDNVSRGGGGIGIYNQGTLMMTNATLAGNILYSETSPSGGGLYNAGRAGLANVTIRNNSAISGGGVFNTGSMVLANCIVSRNKATGSGGGIVNTAGGSPDGRVAALLVNVTLAGNEASQGGALYNEYEGYPENQLRSGSVNVMLQNVRITGNKAGKGGGIYNRYFRFSGMGIFLTLSGTTIAGNDGGGLYTRKDSSNTGADYRGSGYDDPADPDKLKKNSFPVYIRFWNTVVYGNTMPDAAAHTSGKASVWDWTGFSNYTAQSYSPPEDRETYEYSLLQGMDLSASGGNLDGTGSTPFASIPNYTLAPTTGGNYLPGSILDGKGGAGRYPENTTELLGWLLWEPSIPDAGTIEALCNNALPVYFGWLPNPDDRLSGKTIFYFLDYDNSFNIGDLRYQWHDSEQELAGDWVTSNLRSVWSEGPKSKTRPGVLDIGAYEN